MDALERQITHKRDERIEQYKQDTAPADGDINSLFTGVRQLFLHTLLLFKHSGDEFKAKVQYTSLGRSYSRLVLWYNTYQSICDTQQGDLPQDLIDTTTRYLKDITNTLVDRLLHLASKESAAIVVERLDCHVQDVKSLIQKLETDGDNDSDDSSSYDYDSYTEVAEDLKTDTTCLVGLNSLINRATLDPTITETVTGAIPEHRELYQSHCDRISNRFPNGDERPRECTMASPTVLTLEKQTKNLISTFDAIPTVDSLSDVKNLPHVFIDVSQHLPVAKNALQAILDQVTSKQNVKFCGKALDFMGSCQSEADALIKIFQQVMGAPEGHRPNYYCAAVGELRVSSLETLLRHILSKIQGCLLCDREIRAVLYAELEAVETAIERADYILPSLLPKTDDSLTITHYGQGSQNIQTGSGKQNNNNAGGTQYNGEEFGRDFQPFPAKETQA